MTLALAIIDVALLVVAILAYRAQARRMRHDDEMGPRGRT